MFDVVQHIILADLPSRTKLKELSHQGFIELVNVSGVDLYQLYGSDFLSQFKIAQFTFKDVFSEAPEPSGGVELSAIPYKYFTDISKEEDRQAFFQATNKVIEYLEQKKPLYLCCHQGIGRSPCVLFSALTYLYRQDYNKTLKIIKFLNPKSGMSTVSYSAVNWFQTQMGMSKQ